MTTPTAAPRADRSTMAPRTSTRRLLRLTSETLRELTSDDLAGVVGGSRSIPVRA